jgi:hypothetical protein
MSRYNNTCDTCGGKCHKQRCAYCTREAGHKQKAPSGFCPKCFNMPWRRPERGSCLCGKRFELEPRPEPVALLVSCELGVLHGR